jgi:hypothetical protein
MVNAAIRGDAGLTSQRERPVLFAQADAVIWRAFAAGAGDWG